MFAFVQMLSPVVAVLGIAGVARYFTLQAQALQPVRVRARRHDRGM
ncbi:hypothetical protein [Komagataeibacter medellinensis]|nr:hypothetical protein [Komagataeibacter medellinensis]